MQPSVNQLLTLHLAAELLLGRKLLPPMALVVLVLHEGLSSKLLPTVMQPLNLSSNMCPE